MKRIIVTLFLLFFLTSCFSNQVTQTSCEKYMAYLECTLKKSGLPEENIKTYLEETKKNFPSENVESFCSSTIETFKQQPLVEGCPL